MCRRRNLVFVFVVLVLGCNSNDKLGVALSSSSPTAPNNGSGRPVAIVTGGTRGIGAGIAAALAEEGGYDLLLTYNSNREAAQEFASTLNSCRAECVGGDISLPETRDAIFACLDEKFANQQVRAMVHNAGQYVGITSSNADGIEPPQKLLQFGDGSLLDDNGRADLGTMRYYQRMYGEAFVDLCERFLVRIPQDDDDNGTGGGGSIVGLNSPGVTPFYYGPERSYSMPGSGKCIMEYSMRIYALVAAAKGVNCNLVVPGITRTDAWTNLAKSRGMPDEKQLMQGIIEARCPMKKALSPRDIGNVVAFLCSPAGRYVTGTVIPVDGGIHLKM